MTKPSFLILILALICTLSHAQVPDNIVRKYRLIVRLIKEDKAAELSKHITYPLRRTYPLPPINTPTAFVAYYHTLFDGAFKEKLKCYTDSAIFEHNEQYGLVYGDCFNGDICMDYEGMISAINYSSAAELTLLAALTQKVKAGMHQTVRAWDQNIILARSDKLLIRVDLIDTVYRYACWSKGKTMAAEPDLILYHGVQEQQGTMGGFTYTFTNKGWIYIIDQADMCDDPKDCGLFLNLSYNGQQKTRTRLKEIK